MGLVASIKNFNRNGLLEWSLQRVTSLIMTAYVLFVTYYLLTHPNIDYSQWRDLNGIFLMKVLSIMTVSSIALHSIIGLWGVITDYITVRLLGPKAVTLNLIFQIGMIAITLVYLVWAISIIWSI
jgi:succinate dehydrogenase / fumarate reductase membrane anchor subunit